MTYEKTFKESAKDTLRMLYDARDEARRDSSHAGRDAFSKAENAIEALNNLLDVVEESKDPPTFYVEPMVQITLWLSGRKHDEFCKWMKENDIKYRGGGGTGYKNMLLYNYSFSNEDSLRRVLGWLTAYAKRSASLQDLYKSTGVFRCIDE